jgi:hypothetical protein
MYTDSTVFINQYIANIVLIAHFYKSACIEEIRLFCYVQDTG